jgi:hypothetical protein
MTITKPTLHPAFPFEHDLPFPVLLAVIMASTPTPFQLHVSDVALKDLKTRLSLTRFPDELEKAEWNYGSPLKDIKRLVARWQDGFDWRAAETEINKLPMFTTPVAVDGFGELDIHFVHKRSSVDGAIPLIFVHGCNLNLLTYSLSNTKKDCRARPFPRGF